MPFDARVSSKTYVLDTNVLIHDPTAILNFEDNQVVVPMAVLEELDKLKTGKHAFAADCRSAIRLIDGLIGQAPTETITSGVPIPRSGGSKTNGTFSILMTSADQDDTSSLLSNDINDNRIINRLLQLQGGLAEGQVILVSKDINMRLKARSCGIDAQDYQNDQLVSDVKQLTKGFINIEGSFWDVIGAVETSRDNGRAFHRMQRQSITFDVQANEFIVDAEGFVGKVVSLDDEYLTLLDLHPGAMQERVAWGLKPRNLCQAMALELLLDPDVHLVTLTGAAGSGKTILALAAALEMTLEQRRFNKIIATRSTPPLAEDHGFLPGTEEEKMDPWLGAISDNIEALHINDERPQDSVAYVRSKANIQFKALNYIRGRSFQKSLIIIDECQNLTPYQMKAILTRAGEGSKVICLGNLAQIDTPYLSSISSGLTYMTERFRQFSHGGNMHLNGVPRSLLAEFAETNL